jgi:PiT family inorganic phosphate transporter
MKIRPVNGVSADLTGASVILGASVLGIPVSTTHVITSSILGVGASHRLKGVKWGTAKTMIITWFITLPISATIAALSYFVLNLIF